MLTAAADLLAALGDGTLTSLPLLDLITTFAVFTELRLFSYYIVQRQKKSRIAWWPLRLAGALLAYFGGTSMAHLLAGSAPGVLRSEILLPLVILNWMIVHAVPLKQLEKFRELAPVRALIFLGANACWAHAMTTWSVDVSAENFTFGGSRLLSNRFSTGSHASAAPSSPSKMDPIPDVSVVFPLSPPLVSLLLFGFLGGCGGALLESALGLKTASVAKSWRFQAPEGLLRRTRTVDSAAAGSLFYVLATNHCGWLPLGSLTLDRSLAKFLVFIGLVVTGAFQDRIWPAPPPPPPGQQKQRASATTGAGTEGVGAVVVEETIEVGSAAASPASGRRARSPARRYSSKKTE